MKFYANCSATGSVLTLIFFTLPGYERNAFAIQGKIDPSDGKCVAYYYKVEGNSYITNQAWPSTWDFSGIFALKTSGDKIIALSPPWFRLSGISIGYYKWYGFWGSPVGVDFYSNMNIWPWDEEVFPLGEQMRQEYGVKLGIPEGKWPREYWPDGPPADCGIPCVEEKQAKIAECGGADLVDWETWSDQTCEGGQCTTKKENGYGPPSCENR
jgi:hypothetical protein